MQKEERHPLSDAMRTRVLQKLVRTQQDSLQLDHYLRDTVKRFA